VSDKPLVLTLGEPAGIGPDIAIEAWRLRTPETPVFVFAGDADLLFRRARAVGHDIPIERVTAGQVIAAFGDALPCLEGAQMVVGMPGVIQASDTPAVIASIRSAVELVRHGEAAAVVTAPIHKKALNDIGFPFPGHTEFLGALSEELFGEPAMPVMLLAGPELRVVPVTIHIPLADVPRNLTTDLIVRTASVVVRDLKARFGIDNPRLAVSGLNPHAGEDGMLGSEDAAIVRPAVEALRAEGVRVSGPLPADTMFHPAARATYDVALCMYHDQALIPIKTLAFDEGVNVTLGLPFVRTSPDHGTALSLAGTGKAKPDSLIAALRLAARLAHGKAPA
jgi:4-hydroxythreonine-4-phosphate dehydrogenase